MNIDAIAAALTDAMPVLAVTVLPVLATAAGVALWLRSQQPADTFNVDDYKPAPGEQAGRRLRPAEAYTRPVPVAAWTAAPAYTEVADRLLTTSTRSGVTA